MTTDATHRLSRRALLRGAAIAAPLLNFGMHRLAVGDERAYSTRCVDLVRESLVIDMLAPIALEMEQAQFSKPLSMAARAQFKVCGITGFHNATGISGPNAREEVEQDIAAWSGFAGRNSDVFSLVGVPEDLDTAKRDGKIAVIIGQQNSDHFRETKDVALFYALGQRCSQLTYNAQNLLGSGSLERVDGGLSEFGVAIVKAMNQTGMLVDVSHCGDRTTLDSIETSSKPIAITHSNCRALNDHPRLKTDEAIQKLAAKGGVIGMTGVRMFVRDREPTTVEHIVDHIDHVRALVGTEHVGIGSDSDLSGYDHMMPAALQKMRDATGPRYRFRARIDTDGFDHPRKVFDLTEALIRRRYSADAIRGILGGNFRRLLASVWI